MANLLLLGAGGFGQTVRETAELTGQYDKIAFLDDAAQDERVVGKCMDYAAFRAEYPVALAALGNNGQRLQWTKTLLEAGFTVPALVHPSASVSPSAQLGAGSFVMQHAVVNTGVQVGVGCLINCGAIVDHNSTVGDGAHIGLGSVVKANCRIEPGRKVEAGEVIFSTRRKIDGVESRELENALYAFGFGNQCSFVRPFGAGHINETYAVYMPSPEGEKLCYVLQRVNTAVFHSPAEVMENIFGVTQYLRQEIRAEGGNADRETLSYIKTREGENYFEDVEGQPWRCYNYIPDSVCYQQVERPEQFYESARSFGHFLKQLGNYPADTLHETIPHFHDTPSRFADFAQALARDTRNRAAGCRAEIAFVQAHAEKSGWLMEQLHSGALPLRVTHNDTKLNNILFDAKTGRGLCVIDLDTIMPGLAANDFGDSIRFGASTAAEDETDISKVKLDLHLFELYAKGYLEEVGDVLTSAEKESLAWGALLITLECGVRFLTDHLRGDVYFKVQHPGHNLERCRTQFALVAQMEEHFDEMQSIVKKYS